MKISISKICGYNDILIWWRNIICLRSSKHVIQTHSIFILIESSKIFSVCHLLPSKDSSRSFKNSETFSFKNPWVQTNNVGSIVRREILGCSFQNLFPSFLLFILNLCFCRRNAVSYCQLKSQFPYVMYSKSVHFFLHQYNAFHWLFFDLLRDTLKSSS